MALGNGNPKTGDKGSNFKFELSVLQLLNTIANSAGGGSTGGATQVTLQSVLNNVTSKIDRIKGSANYSRTFTYDAVGTQNIITIVHTGLTALGNETLTETISYVNAAINGSNVTNIVYS